MVTSAADSGDGSFRAAIEAADLDTTTPVVEIDFALGADSSTTIRPTTALPTITRPVLINGYTQDSWSPRVILDGSLAPTGTDGLTIAGGGSVVEGMDITGFVIHSPTNFSSPMNYSGGRGILLTGGGGDRIVGDEIGDFGSLVGNSLGIEVDAPDATIGGGGVGLGDVISGNGASHDPYSPIGGGDGINVDAVAGAVIQGDKIGTDPTGLFPDGNAGDGLVFLDTIAPLIGGPEAGDGNVISGNRGVGIDLGSVASTPYVSDATIQGNFIGVGADGKAGLGGYVYDEGPVIMGNSYGISANAIGITIGGTTAAERNVVSGNNYAGITIGAYDYSAGQGVPGGAGTLIQGNFVGTEADGVTPAGNYGPGIEAYDGGTIGGTVAGAGNVVSSNGGQWGSNGIDAEGFLIQGNRIGTDLSGTLALGNGTGVVLRGSDTLGGLTPAARNVISGNRVDGVVFADDGSEPTGPSIVEGNFIGVDVTGTKPLGNTGNGIQVEDDSINGEPQPPAGPAESLTIGGSVVGAGNVIGGNKLAGIALPGSGPESSNDLGKGISVLVQGNSIGVDASGTIPLPNSGDGIDLDSTLTPATIGGTNPGEGNTIADNEGGGVVQKVGGYPILGNAIYGNSPKFFPIISPSFAQDPAPDLTAAISQGGQVTISGTFAAPAGSSRTFEFFAGADSANAGGQVYLGTTQGTADAAGRGAFQVTFPTPAAGLGRFLATAIEPVSASEPFGATSDFSNGVTASPATAPTADLVVAGSGPTAAENPAGIGTYTFTVTNAGTSPAFGVTLNELFPDGGPLQSATTSQGTIAFTTDGNFVGEIGDLAPGASASVTFRAAFSGLAGGEYQAETLVTSLTPDVDPLDNSLTLSTPVSASAPVPPVADFSLAATATTRTVSAWTEVTYNLTATNAGPGDAEDSALFFTLPDAAIVVSATSSQGTVVVDRGPNSGGIVTAYFGAIPAQADGKLTIVVRVASTPKGQTLVSQGVIRGANSSGDDAHAYVNQQVAVD